MKINKKIVIFFCTALIILSIFPTYAVCQTTIGDSTVPVEEGETYKYVCTYCDPTYSLQVGVGSYSNLTIDNIYQGSCSYMGITNALIINATRGSWNKPTDSHESEEIPYVIVYNFTLRYFNYYATPFMIPIPLNFTFACESIAYHAGGTCNFTGNQITHEDEPDEIRVYTFNSNGIMTKAEYYDYGIKLYTYELETSSEQGISFGHHYILLSIVAVVVVTLVVKKRKLNA
ncbi:MAG: hypothetical protein ACFFBC_11585 [Promethearchaeota archaeon]